MKKVKTLYLIQILPWANTPHQVYTMKFHRETSKNRACWASEEKFLRTKEYGEGESFILFVGKDLIAEIDCHNNILFQTKKEAQTFLDGVKTAKSYI